MGISNGSPAYVVGSASGNKPVRWSLTDPTQPTLLPLPAGQAFGTARGVNDAGDAVGSIGSGAAMWLAAGAPILIATPAGFTRAEGRAIDAAGLAVFQFLTATSEIGGPDRGYLRLASGAMILMPPAGADVASYVNDVGEVANGHVYVAGSTSSSAQVDRAVRWTVDATTGAIVATDILATTGSHGLGVSDAGGIAGFIVNRSLIGEAFLWRGTSVLKLGLPKGARDARAWAFSRSGQYVAGQARSGGGRGLRWRIATP